MVDIIQTGSLFDQLFDISLSKKKAAEEEETNNNNLSRMDIDMTAYYGHLK